MPKFRPVPVCLVALSASAAVALGGDGGALLRLDPAAVQPAPSTSGQPVAEQLRFLDEGYDALTIGAIGALDLEDNLDTALTLSYTRFLTDRFEWGAELGLWGFFQEGDDAVGASVTAMFRYHFWNTADAGPLGPDWTSFFELGIGVMGSSDDVPFEGTSFNFMPRIGIGVTKRINDRGWRAVAGVRWHHISNARINSQESNPSRDSASVFFGLSIPL